VAEIAKVIEINEIFATHEAAEQEQGASKSKSPD
jgi:hypothetical protein